jgi:beta-xylosidase
MKFSIFRCVFACLAAWPAWYGGSALAQHGVIREYAALAPRPDAVPLRPLLEVPLSSPSISPGPDGAYYLTGTPIENGQPFFSSTIRIWRSSDLINWREVRTLHFEESYRSPELRYLKDTWWLALERGSGGTTLVKLTGDDPASADCEKQVITEFGITPSIFRDDDGKFFWILGGGKIARMNPNPLAGLVEEPRQIDVKIAGPHGQQREQRVLNLHGAHLAKIAGRYHLFISGRIKRNGLGRTGRPEGADDVLVAASARPDGGYSPFYVAFPNAGESTVFQDAWGAWWGTWSGTDGHGILRDRPGMFRIEQVPASEARWPMGFAATESPNRFPFELMLRPDTSFIYERGMGTARAIALDLVPGQEARTPWIRDTFIMLGRDRQYYLTGTSGNMDGINLWRSKDLKRFEFVKQVWTPRSDTNLWYNSDPKRLIWAPELHYLKGTYWIPFCLSAGKQGKNSLLKSTSGKPEGPYELAFSENRGVDADIDSSLFADTDGTVYYVWQDGKIRQMNSEMSGFSGETRIIIPADGRRVGYEGASLVKAGKWYVLTAAEWNGGGNRSDGTYDMMYSCATNLSGPWRPRRVAVPHAGHGALFRDKAGRWHASFFGNDRTAPFRAMPGVVPVDLEAEKDDLVIRLGL